MSSAPETMYRTLHDVHRAYEAGVSVEEVARAARDRALRGDLAEAWIHIVDEERLTADAHRLQRLLDAHRAQGTPLPPLFGIPFAVKDNIDVAGAPTTAACPGYARHPVASAFAVQKLLDAGALFIGKTNLDQFATGLVGTRSPYGACKNPYNPAYITGGSSSGSALAVAGGAVVFALGTDTAGSGRVPAGFCNLVGLKPTKGLVSTRGVVPACPSLDCVTVFARGGEDAFAVLGVMEGYDTADPYSRRAPEKSSHAPARPVLTERFRFGVPRAGQLDFEGDAGYEALYAEAIAEWTARGGTAVAVDVEPLLEAARLLYSGPWLAERAEAIIGAGTFGAERPEALLPLLRTILEPAQNITAMDAFRGFGRLQELIRAAQPLWDAIDFLLLPTAATIFTHAQIAEEPLKRNAVLGRFTNFVNLMDLSAVALPAGFRADGLPFGITVLAPAFKEDLLEQASAVWEHRPASIPSRPVAGETSARTPLLVFGLHLSGMALNPELTELGATLERTVKTSSSYRMALIKRGEKRLPGVWRQPGTTGVPLEGEVWSLPDEQVGAFFKRVPSPLCLGSIELSDGTYVKGFLGEAAACEQAEDISRYGGWRAWVGAS